MNGISKSFSKFYYYIMLNNNILSFADGKNIKAVFFDMDGVLFDSMPYHAQAWQRALSERGLSFSLYDAYLHEGRTADSTIDEAFIRAYGHTADRRTKDEIYSTKTDYFHQYPEPPQIPAVADVLRYVRSKNRQILVVTGSAQMSLLDRLQSNFPDIFEEGKIISAFDVEHGKPHPEPYLIALRRAGVAADEAIVVENAPLGVRSAVAAGISTIAVNTGVLDSKVLADEGASVVLSDMQELKQVMQIILT